MAYALTRQRDFSDNRLYVEIAVGGIKKAGIDILTPRYKDLGEGKSLIDPRDAVRLAIDIFGAWEKDYWDESKRLRITGAQSPPIIFEFNERGIQYATQWAEKTYQSMTKCGHCSKAMGNRAPSAIDDIPNLVFCSENCAARKYRDMFGVEIPTQQVKTKPKILKFGP